MEPDRRLVEQKKWKFCANEMVSSSEGHPFARGGRGTPYNGLYGEAKKVPFSGWGYIKG